MLIVIDLIGDEDEVKIGHEEDPKEIKLREEHQQRVLEEMYRRAPQPQVVPVEHN